MRAPPDATAPFEVVFVCTGNRARSPIAEALYGRFTAGLDTEASSYGTQDVSSIPPLPDAIHAAALLGLDLTGHRSRPLRDARLSSADLVLGFELHHVASAVVDAQAPADRTFLLAELVALLDAPQRGSTCNRGAAAVVAEADTRRVRSRPSDEFVVRDPLGKPTGIMLETATQIELLIRGLVVGLFGPALGWKAGTSSVQ